MRRTITAIIPTFNEEDNIEAAIASVAWCDRILVIDSLSSDGTQGLAKEAGADVIVHAFEGHALQKNHAISLVNSDWVLILDADERITPALRSEIEEVLAASSPSHTAYWIKRRNHFMGQEIKYSGWQGDKVIRLFAHGACAYEIKQVHEEMVCKSSVGMLRQPMTHFTYKNFNHYMEKFDRYTTLSAQDRKASTPKVTLYHLWVKPSFRFFRHYILKGGILDGKAGFVISTLSAYSVFLRYLKLDRMHKGETI